MMRVRVSNVTLASHDYQRQIVRQNALRRRSIPPAVSPVRVTRKTLRLGSDKQSAPPPLSETTQTSLDTLAFQLLALRGNPFQELICRATQRTLLRPDRHDLREGLGARSERYSGKSLRPLSAAIAGTSEMPTPERTRA